jgi:hypothetical protein
MKPLHSTLCLINYQWWHDHAMSVVRIASQYEMHKRPEQMQRAANQAIEAATIAGKWHLRWLASF